MRLSLIILVEIIDPGNPMKQILQEISEHVLLLNEYDFTEEQVQSKWLGNPPATDEEINKAQALLQITLPEDYIEFLKISNGFH